MVGVFRYMFEDTLGRASVGRTHNLACLKSWAQTRCAGVHLFPELGVGAGGERIEGTGTCLATESWRAVLTTYRLQPVPGSPALQRPAHLPSHTVAIQCLETAFGVTVEDRDLALPQTLPEIFEAAAASKVSLGLP